MTAEYLDTIFFVGAVVTAILLIAANYVFFRKHGSSPRPGWLRIASGNALLTLFLLSLVFLSFETYYRFLFDATDRMMSTKVSQRWYERHWETNNRGARDDLDYSYEKPAGLRRITFLGDSFTAGHGVLLEERFANVIRKARPDWQIHALARLGSSTAEQLALLEKVIQHGYELDVVVLVYYFDDIFDFMDQAELARFITDFITIPPIGLRFLVERSFAINTLYYRWTQREYSPTHATLISLVEDAYSNGPWQQQRKLLSRVNETVRRNGGTLATVTFPWLIGLDEGESQLRVMHERLDEAWREEGAPHLDLLPVFLDHAGEGLIVSKHDDHPSVRAHLLAAKEIEDLLENTVSEIQTDSPAYPSGT
jgi:hypothetical protein